MGTERKKFLKELMIFGGLWINFSGHRFPFLLYCFQIFRLFYLALGCCFIVNALFSKGLTFLLTPTAAFMPMGFTVVSTSIALLLKFNELEELIEIGDRDLCSYHLSWEKEIIESDTKIVTDLGKLFKRLVCIFTAIYVMLPIIIDIFRVIFGYNEPYLVPLPFDGYFEAVKVRNLNLYLVILASYLWFAFGIPNTIAFQCNFFIIVSYTTTQIKIVREHLKRISEQLDSGTSSLPNLDLRYIIKRHQQILRLNRLQRDRVPLVYSIQSVISTVSVCFVMYLIDQLYGKDNLVVILALMFMGILLGILFITCFAGDYLEDEGFRLFHSICNLPWSRQSPKVRKDIILLILQSSRPLSLDYKKTLPINFVAFMQTVNNAYSYFMIMKSVEK